MSRPAASLLLLAAALSATPAFPADTNFYTLNQRWEKSNPAEKQESVVDDAFRSALTSQAPLSRPAVPSVNKTLAELGILRTITLEQHQTLVISGSRFRKYLATEEGIVWFEPADDITLLVEARTIGSTFVHVWDDGGRTTFEVLVLAPKIVLTQEEKRQLDDLERTRSFKFEYRNSRGAFYTAATPRELRRNTLDFNQKLSMEGETPYGIARSHMQMQKDRSKTLITDTQVSIEGTDIGPVKDVNAAVGDSRIETPHLSFPGSRIRGVELDHAYPPTGVNSMFKDPKYGDEKLKWLAFHGREETSVVGTLSPGLVTRKTRTSFLSGVAADYKVNDAARVQGGFFNGYGRSRPDELNRHGFGLRSEIEAAPWLRLVPATDFDSEKLAHRPSFLIRGDAWTLRNEFRDISKRFVTLAGNPARQGEIGNLVSFTGKPLKGWDVMGSVDLFRDRLIPNPDDPDHLNRHQDWQVTYTPRDRTSLVGTYQDYDDTGRIGPSKFRVVGLQANQVFDLWGHRATAFARYQNRGSRILNNHLSDYVQNQVSLGFYTELFWGIQLNVQKDWSVLEETNLRRITHPEVLTVAFDYSKQLGDSPFYLDARLRLRDEEEAESPQSFLSGEDSAELSGGLYYRPHQDAEYFLTGSFQNFRPESRNVTEPRVEAQFLTGMRYLYDTGYRWESVGNFRGTVFKDVNGDGVRQAGEPGMKGQVVRLRDLERVTDDNGVYEFKSVAGKSAVILLDSKEFPQGYAPTSAMQQEIPIVQGRATEVDFGLTPRSEVVGVVYADSNGNGRYDIGEDTLKKVRVTMEDGKTAVTSARGMFSFPEVIAGDHRLTLDVTTLPDGYLPREKPVKDFTLFEGMRYQIEFPVKAARTLAGRAWIDANGNKRFDAGEAGAGQVIVSLAGEPALTDDEGYFLFEGVRSLAGKQELRVDPSTLPPGTLAPEPQEILIPAGTAQITGIDLPLALKEQPKPAVAIESVSEESVSEETGESPEETLTER